MRESAWRMHWTTCAADMDIEVICGVDEAGRGALAGPVVAAAVILGNASIEGIADSKKLTAARRKELNALIVKECVDFAYGVGSVEEINEINILNATMNAMQRAICKIAIVPDKVLIDGNTLPELPYECEAIVSGDSLVREISAASILAKVERDRIMEELAKKHPEYGFDIHKGYPTAEHLDALQRHGVLALHRKRYAPVRELLDQGRSIDVPAD